MQTSSIFMIFRSIQTSPIFMIFRLLIKISKLLGKVVFVLSILTRKIFQTFYYLLGAARIRGFQRFLVEIISDGLTVGLIILVGVLVLGQYALNDVDKNWQNNLQYSINFYDKNNVLIGHRGIRHDNPAPISQLPKHMILATLATEDRKFYDHIGIDPLGIVRAFIHNVEQPNASKHGASTITQQLAKNLFFDSRQSLDRKIKEAYMAIWLELNMSKDDILNLYFDLSYLGGGNFGLEAAAQFYFSKSARDVTMAEAAMLAGLFKAPSHYAPHINLEAAQNRADLVLTNMVNSGYFTEAQVAYSRNNPATINTYNHVNNKAEYFLDWAFEKAKALAKNKGHVLKVKTTLDLTLQANAKLIIKDNLNQEGKKYNVDQASLVSMEYDGAVLALIGGKDYKESQFNRAVHANRQPGSSFKPLVYLAALNYGFTPESSVIDSRIRIKKWSPKNYSNRYIGHTNLNNALVKSINTVAVKLGHKIGNNNIINLAKSLGIDANLQPNPSLPLGTSSISVMDLTGAYTTIANGGTLAQPYGITEITKSDGRVIYHRIRDEFAPQVVANPYKVAELKYMLGNVVEHGTGKRAQLGFTKTYGKTGTTQSYRDAWFIGFTDHIVTGVWYGNDNYSPTKRLTGGRLPAQTFKKFMTEAYISKFGLDVEAQTFVAVANITTPYNAIFNRQVFTDVTLDELKAVPVRTATKISRSYNIIKISSYAKKSFNSKIKSSSVTLNGNVISAFKHKAKPKKSIYRKPKISRDQSAYIDASGKIIILSN